MRRDFNSSSFETIAELLVHALAHVSWLMTSSVYAYYGGSSCVVSGANPSGWLQARQ